MCLQSKTLPEGKKEKRSLFYPPKVYPKHNQKQSKDNIRRQAPPALISALDNAGLHPCDLRSPPYFRLKMDDTMKKFQGKLIEIETEAEELLLARHQLVENDRLRNGNREALTALRKRARTTKTSVPSPFELLMKEVDQSKPLVKEICATCGNHDSNDKTWMMFPGTDIFARVPFHAAHTILEKDQTKLDFDVKKLQSYVKEKSLFISEQGVLADKIGPGVLKSLVTLQDKPR
ncbi:unnamed protein product [Lactuca virosa]|uniref:P53 and DNA damage-regulated protein 1 n=1 Tax=Lactuca virosa TaxID=75947 RepID=A0AAU9LQA5_9ASTR|nr:unnamed protein product [Lactuca virosa]